MDLREYFVQLAAEQAEVEDIDYITNDPIRKFQIDYDKTVCLSEKYPEAFHVEKEGFWLSGQLNVAPGEGKCPENILFTENWDAQASRWKIQFELQQRGQIK